MKIPEVRAEIADLAVKLTGIAERLTALCIELHRRPAVRKAKVSSKPLTSAVVAAIKRTGAQHRHWSYEEIAQHHGVNIGRVSEVLRGKRK